MFQRKISKFLFIMAFIPAFASADTYLNGFKNATFDVTLKVIADCAISAAPLDFGQTQGLISSVITVNSNLSVTCTNTTLYNIGLNPGTGTGSLGTTRYLSGTGSNTNTVLFNLFQNAGAGVWGNTQGTDTKAGTGTGITQTITVYGQIPVQTSPTPDTYKSTITATIYF